MNNRLISDSRERDLRNDWAATRGQRVFSLCVFFLLLLLILIGMCLAMAGCSSAPTVITAANDKINLGVSFLENTTDEYAQASLAGGVTVSYHKTGKNQTSGLTQLVGYRGVWKGVQAAAGTANLKASGTNALNLKTAVVPKNPNIIPKNPNVIPVNPNVIPVNPNLH